MASFGLDPQILAQLAAAGFKPPPPMQMAPMNLNPQMPNPGPQQQGGGDGLAGGIAGLGAMMPGLAKAFGSKGAGADLNGFNGSGPMVNVGGGQMLPNPNGMQFGAGGVPLGTPAGQPDFLTGLLSRFGFGGR